MLKEKINIFTISKVISQCKHACDTIKKTNLLSLGPSVCERLEPLWSKSTTVRV